MDRDDERKRERVKKEVRTQWQARVIFVVPFLSVSSFSHPSFIIEASALRDSCPFSTVTHDTEPFDVASKRERVGESNIRIL